MKRSTILCSLLPVLLVLSLCACSASPSGASDGAETPNNIFHELTLPAVTEGQVSVLDARGSRILYVREEKLLSKDGGYAYYEDTVPVRKYKKMVPLPVRRALGNLALHMPYFKGHNFLVKGAEIPEKSFLGLALVWPEREVDGVLKPEYNTGDGAFERAAPIYARVKGQPELVKKQYLDMNMWLPGDILLKADKMCMAHSLELRVPFLDRKVMEFAEHIPDRYRINENGNKQVLRHAANKSLPDEWATRPKVGFPVPNVYWLREQKWYDYVKEYFTAPWASEFFNTDELMHLLDLHFAGKGDFQRKIYTPLVFLVWYKRFFIDEGQPSVQAA